MIIVSQSKFLLNYSNVVTIYKTLGDEKNVKIEATTVNDEYVNLGEYDTEKRANEVLSEIVKCYVNTEQYKCICDILDYSTERIEHLNELAENAVIYIMPKE